MPNPWQNRLLMIAGAMAAAIIGIEFNATVNPPRPPPAIVRSAPPDTALGPEGGALFFWGYPTRDAHWMGDTAQPITRPVLMQGYGSGVTWITARSGTACMIRRGAVLCWGANTLGQLGDGGRRAAGKPVEVAGLPGPASRVETDGNQTCALILDGRIFCWGGQGTQAPERRDVVTWPVEVKGLPGPATSLSVGCALVSGDAYCWGKGNFARPAVKLAGLPSGLQAIELPYAIKDGALWRLDLVSTDRVERMSPEPALAEPVDGTGGRAFALGGDGCFVIESSVRCDQGIAVKYADQPSPISLSEWFGKRYRQPYLEYDGRVRAFSTLATDVDDLDASGGVLCAIVKGEVRCLGDGYYGQLGPQLQASAVPVTMPIPNRTAVQVAVGGDFVIALVR